MYEKDIRPHATSNLGYRIVFLDFFSGTRILNSVPFSLTPALHRLFQVSCLGTPSQNINLTGSGQSCSQVPVPVLLRFALG